MNVYGDTYYFVEEKTLYKLHSKIESKASDGYELVAMMNAGNSFTGAEFVAAMKKVESKE
jgi:hypothetical protein